MKVYLTPIGHALGDLEETVFEAAARGRLVSHPARPTGIRSVRLATPG